MMRVSGLALWSLAAFAALACSRGERATGKDTTSSPPSPAGDRSARRAPAWVWDTAAGPAFAIRATSSDSAILVTPAFTADDLLDTLPPGEWDASGAALEFIAGGLTAAGTITGAGSDSSCSGWPTAKASSIPGMPDWRVAFPAGRVTAVSFDSLPALAPRDSAAVTTIAARAASRLPDDTSAAFRGRPYIVRQANRFATGDSSIGMLVEVVRLVPQEANPLQEQILMILETGADRRGPLETGFHVREIGFEESISSVDVLAVLRVNSSGRLALLVRREREGGFLLQWIERVGRNRWAVRWLSALDSC